MLCDICQKNDATIHIQEIVNGQKKTIHLCGECAAQKQGFSGFDFGPFNLAEVLYKLSGSIADAAQSAAQAQQHESSASTDGKTSSTPESAPETLKCPLCHWSEQMLRKTGQLGCAHCYEVFAPLMADALQNMHRGTTHLGKHPCSGSAEEQNLRNKRAEVNQLQSKLQEAVRDEIFETAATLRDQINLLKNEIATEETLCETNLHCAEQSVSPEPSSSENLPGQGE